MCNWRYNVCLLHVLICDVHVSCWHNVCRTHGEFQRCGLIWTMDSCYCAVDVTLWLLFYCSGGPRGVCLVTLRSVFFSVSKSIHYLFMLVQLILLPLQPAFYSHLKKDCKLSHQAGRDTIFQAAEVSVILIVILFVTICFLCFWELLSQCISCSQWDLNCI